jgi:hypothetical protein
MEPPAAPPQRRPLCLWALVALAVSIVFSGVVVHGSPMMQVLAPPSTSSGCFFCEKTCRKRKKKIKEIKEIKALIN